MIAFIVIAGLMMAVALVFVVFPLIGRKIRLSAISHDQSNVAIYRDQLKELENDLVNGTLDSNQFENARRELEKRALEEVDQSTDAPSSDGKPLGRLALTLSLLFAVGGISAYLLLGTPSAIDQIGAQSGQGSHDLSPQRISEMIARIKSRLKENPDDVEGWIMLAKTSQAIGQYPEAVLAYREVIRRTPPDAQLLADFADTLAVANGRTLTGEPEQLIEKALTIDPANVKALALGGTVAFQKQNYTRAAQLWNRVLEQVPPDSEFAQRIKTSVSEAVARGAAPQVTGQSKKSLSSVTGSTTVSGKVSIAPGVSRLVSPEDTVFIYARAANGPKMPLAVMRVFAKELPTSFQLTEAMAMAPGTSIKDFQQIVVGARISKAGSAVPQAGDLESALATTTPGSSGLNLVISQAIK